MHIWGIRLLSNFNTKYHVKCLSNKFSQITFIFDRCNHRSNNVLECSNHHLMNTQWLDMWQFFWKLNLTAELFLYFVFSVVTNKEMLDMWDTYNCSKGSHLQTPCMHEISKCAAINRWQFQGTKISNLKKQVDFVMLLHTVNLHNANQIQTNQLWVASVQQIDPSVERCHCGYY